MDSSSSAGAYLGLRKLTKIQASRAPEMLCQAEKIAPGTVAIGMEVK